MRDGELRSTAIEQESEDLDRLAYRVSSAMHQIADNVFRGVFCIDSFVNHVDQYTKSIEERLGIKSDQCRLSDSVSTKSISFGHELEPYFALHYALHAVNPNKVVAIMGGARNYAGASEFFGFPVTPVEAHRKTSERYTGTEFRMLSPETFGESDRILILEDAVHFNDTDRTYEIVIKNLAQRGIKKPALFLAHLGLPTILQSAVSEQNLRRIIINDRPYFSTTILPWELFFHSRLLKEMHEKENFLSALGSFTRSICGKGNLGV